MHTSIQNLSIIQKLKLYRFKVLSYFWKSYSEIVNVFWKNQLYIRLHVLNFPVNIACRIQSQQNF